MVDLCRMSENFEKAWSQKARKLGPENLERWRLLSSDLELSEALLEFADYLEDADPGEAYWWYRASCDCDNADACMRLASYLWDYACPRDYLDGDDWKERVDVYRRARKLGHPHTGIDIDPLVKHSLEQLLKRARRGAVGRRRPLAFTLQPRTNQTTNSPMLGYRSHLKTQMIQARVPGPRSVPLCGSLSGFSMRKNSIERKP